jgi:hypothetical protein
MRLRCVLVLGSSLAEVLATAPLVLCRAADEKPAAGPASFKGQVVPFVTKYCTRCHAGRKLKGGLNLAEVLDEGSLARELGLWKKVVQRVRAREMPPRGPKPAPAEVESLTAFLEARLAKADCALRQDPGRVVLRRLNRAEYDNTIRDLVGVRFRPAKDFPADEVGYGFDNIGDLQSVPPLLLEKYLAAAETIVREAFRDPKARARILIAPLTGPDPTGAARKIIGGFAERAFRRPVATPEVDRLVRLVEAARKDGDTLETGLRLALEAVLVSPHFLFRVEADPGPAESRAARPVSEFELATRLSYFLWSSMPDEELFRQAAQKTLRKNLDVQIRRMLRDPKALALVENFGGQWLQTRNLQNAAPNPTQFPGFTPRLRDDMRRETELFFAAIVREDRSVLDFLDADFTYVNERLARHYGIPGVRGDDFRRVRLPGGPRGGVLTQASVLTVTSNPTRTSPVKRGKWILENILGEPPPPPPPDAGELSDDKKEVLSGSLRQRMEKHRAKPMCASCHRRMDPLGFGLENFDAVGTWRARDGKFAVDASGTLPDGKSFRGPRELKAILRMMKDKFARCLTDKLLTYALGRGLEYADGCAVERIARDLAGRQYRFTSLVLGVVHSDPFQLRRGKAKR